MLVTGNGAWKRCLETVPRNNVEQMLKRHSSVPVQKIMARAALAPRNDFSSNATCVPKGNGQGRLAPLLDANGCRSGVLNGTVQISAGIWPHRAAANSVSYRDGRARFETGLDAWWEIAPRQR
jgi:hypothetical protein